MTKSTKRPPPLAAILLASAAVILFAVIYYIYGSKKATDSSTQSRPVNVSNAIMSVQQLLSRKSDCDCQFEGKTFDSSNPEEVIELEELKTGCTQKSGTLIKVNDSNSAKAVERIYIHQIKKSQNKNEFEAMLNIVPRGGNTAFFTKPIPIKFITDNSSGDEKEISSCKLEPLTQPKDIVARPDDGGCHLKWKASSGAGPIFYTVCSSLNKGVSSAVDRTCSSTPSESHEVKGLKNGAKYYFSIQASNPSQILNWTAEIECIPTKPPEVVVVDVKAGKGECVLSWTENAGTAPVTYTVYGGEKSPVSHNGKIICDKITDLNCVSKGLLSGKKILYAVKAYNAAGDSPFSEEVSCIPK